MERTVGAALPWPPLQYVPLLRAGLVGYFFRDVLVKTGAIRIAHLQDSSPDQIPRPVLQTLIPHRPHAHLNWSSRQFKPDVQLSILSGEIVFANPNRGHNERQSGSTHIKRVPIQRRQTPMSMRTQPRI